MDASRAPGPVDPVGRPAESEMWRDMLSGTNAEMNLLRRRWMRVPHGPRCKVCAAPFHGVGSLLTRIVMHGQSVANPTMCGMCFRKLADHPGGAEVDISIVFADIRGSTAIAERMGPGAFRQTLQTFYELSARAVEARDGFVDKYLGDGIMALFVPIFTGESHAERAVSAALDLVTAIEGSSLRASGIRVGAGVHRGPAFVGVLGTGDKLDFSALGDPVNVAARLGGLADGGEVLASLEAWSAAGRPASQGVARRVDIVGRLEPLDVVAVRPAAQLAAAS
jgi:adenylate cyclase